MRSPQSFKDRPHAHNGAALVIVLAFVVLLTVLVVAYFSRTISERQVSNSSANQTKVELFAQGATDAIIGDLDQEIMAGSINTTINTTISTGTSTTIISVPANAATVVPALALTGTSGITSFAPNLLKRSAYNLPLYSGSNYNVTNNNVAASSTTTIVYTAPNRAANISTTAPSLNGRYISTAHWNKPLLLPKLNNASTTDFTPIATGSNAFVPPDWILVARNGSNPTVWNSNMVASATNSTTVTGRFAYVIYDEGGLLDMNAAGFPTGITPAQLGGKGSLALADLTQLTDSSGKQLLSQTQVDSIVGWRNYATIQPPNSFPNFNISGTTGATNYYNFVIATTKGFLAAGNSSLFSGQTDRLFSSRQQLINLLTQGIATSGSLASLQNVLQYMGTFSRDLEQPSFVPDPNRPKNTGHNQATSTTNTTGFGGNSAYSSDGSLQDKINPPLLTKRDSNGQPIVKRRFPLSRLALVQQAAQMLRSSGTMSATLASQIHSYFGLTWDSLNSRWLYTSPDGTSTPASLIKTLDKVAAVNPIREPDFFETLYSVICCDSLGKQHGGTDGSNDTSNSYSPHMYTSNAAAIDGSVEFQVIQIGANLIDQYDSSSYPSCIAYSDTATNTVREFYGIKNLPYLAGWMQSWYRMKHLTAADIDPAKQPPLDSNGNKVYPYETWVMFQPILWNPHAPNPNLNTSLVPTNFRVLATSVYTPPGPGSGLAITIRPQVRPPWWTAAGWQNSYPAAGGMTTSSFSDATIDGKTSVITFNATPNTSGSVPASFQEPYRLLYQYPTGSNANAGYAAGKFALDADGAVADPVLASADAVTDGRTIIGFFGGKCWTGPSTASVPAADYNPAGQEKPYALVNGRESDNLQFRLQYQIGSGAWVTYDVINQVQGYTGNPSTVDNMDQPSAPPAISYIRGFRTCFRADPRTDRWGLFTINTFPLAINPNGVSSPAQDGVNIKTLGTYNLAQATTLNPKAGVIVSGTAGVVYNAQPESAIEECGWTPMNDLTDVMVNVNTGSANSAIPGNKTYYTDPDGVLRRAGGAYFNSGTYDGLTLYSANYTSRPVVLNRPFQSVAEMGYAFSGTPWKDLDFLTQESGDSALLDAFCLNEVDGAPANVTVAGRINLNTNQPEVLQAIISGVSKAEGGILSSTEAAAAAQALVNWTHSPDTVNKGPLRNRSELIGKYVSTVANASTTKLENNTPIVNWDGSKSYSGYSMVLTGTGSAAIFANASDGAIKRRRECVMRALTDSGNTRTWNLMIDLVAQVGSYPASATALSQFNVEGETRYWVHMAIDRYTGQVVGKLVEPVSE